MFALSSAFESLDVHIPAHIFWSTHPCIVSARLPDGAAEAEVDFESDWDTSSNPSIFDTDDESDFGSTISQTDEEFKGTPLSSLPPHVIDEYAVTHTRKTPFVFGRPSPLRASWTAPVDEKAAPDACSDEGEEGLDVTKPFTFSEKPAVTTVVLCWADDDCECVEDLNDLLSFFDAGKPTLPFPGG